MKINLLPVNKYGSGYEESPTLVWNANKIEIDQFGRIFFDDEEIGSVAEDWILINDVYHLGKLVIEA